MTSLALTKDHDLPSRTVCGLGEFPTQPQIVLTVGRGTVLECILPQRTKGIATTARYRPIDWSMQQRCETQDVSSQYR